MSNKFTINLTLSHKEIKGKRAELLSADALAAQEDLVRNLSSEVRNIERTLISLEDLSPDNTVSLNPTKNNFDAKEWVEQMQKNKVLLAMKKVELDIAKETLTEYFSEEDNTTQLT